MPRKLSVDNLKTLCLKNIARHFQNVWFSPFEQLFGNSSRLLHVLGPFDHITSDLNRDLIHVLIDKKQLKVKHLQLLLNNRLTEIDLREARVIANQDSVIDTIASRCQRLVKLNLDNFNKISPKALMNLVSNLTSLRHLSLQFTKCNDKFIEIVGSCCTELVELDITGCKIITDKGFQPLLKCTNGKICLFTKLVLLKMLFTNISSDIVGRLAASRNNLDIQNGRTCEMIDKAFGDSFVSGDNVSKTDQLPIRLLSTEEQFEKLTMEQVALTCAYCPNLTQVILHGNISDECLQPLKHLSNLRKLDLACDQTGQLTFEDGILPLLTNSGHYLLELNLHEIDNICLDLIGSCCVNLCKLKCTLSSISTVTLADKIETKIYTKLTHLDLQLVSNGQTFPAYTLRTILQNAKMIKFISLFYIQSLTTELFLQVLDKNPFLYLCELKLESCDNFTQEAVFKLLSLDNDLITCSLLNCKDISLADFEHFKNFIKQNKLNLEITWN